MSSSYYPSEVDPLDSFFQDISTTQVKKPSIQTIAETSDEDEITFTENREPTFAPSVPKLKKIDNEIPQHLENVANIPLVKNIYIEAQGISKLSPSEVDDIRDKLGNIAVHGINVCCPIEEWTQCGLPNQVMYMIKNLKFTKPTAIQCQAIPCILSGRDVIGCAITGSGKTLAFVLPSILHIIAQPQSLHQNEAMCVFLSPTRELAIQTHLEASKFLKLLDLKSSCLVGGNDVEHQLKSLKNGVHVIVATPGRFIDLMSTSKNFNIARIGFLCIDEADRMFDMGFEPQVMKIASALRKDRQTVMFSATFPHIVERAARKLLSNPVEIVVGVRNTVSPNIEQNVEVLKGENKFVRLLQLLGQYQDSGQALVFTNTQSKAEELFGQLVKRGYKVAMLHAGMDQNDRASILHDFRNGDYTVMVLTSVGSRGIDIVSIVLVINYDAPDHGADYVHRLGRTGRAGNKGWAYTFVEPHEKTNAFEIMVAMKKSKTRVPPELEEVCKAVQPKRQLNGFLGHGFRFDKNESDKIQEERKQVAATEAKTDAEKEEEEDENETNADANNNEAKMIRETNDGNYFTEFVINEFSSKVRLLLTKKETIDTVTDMCGATVIQRGVYCLPGSKPPMGEKKLYFLIEGNSVLSVESAISQFQRIAKESETSKPPPSTKYKVA